jgi:putative transposase
MAEKFNNKYRIASHRKPNWDYLTDALFFLSLVTQNRECNLGNVVNSDGRIYVELSDFGKIVECEWFKSAVNTKIDSYKSTRF